MVCPSAGRHKTVANIPTVNPSFVIARLRPTRGVLVLVSAAIGTSIYSHASVNVPVAIIGPNTLAGLKATPVRAEPFMMWTVT
jgi:hypothetical protein